MDDRMPFTPPPHYVHPMHLPKKHPGRMRGVADNTSSSSGSRGLDMVRRLSSRRAPAIAEGRIEKPSKKKRRPGLSIDTSVTRHRAPAPQEVKVPQNQTSQSSTNGSSSMWAAPAAAVAAAAAATQTQPYPTQSNSPSRFPSTYLDASKRQTLRATEPSQDIYFAPPPQSRSSVYSRSANQSGTRESWRRFSSRRKHRRESTATMFEEDQLMVPHSRRPSSTATLFEEDNVNERDPNTAYTITPHRSRGWWNVITTPFVKSPNDDQRLPAIPAIPAHLNTKGLQQSNSQKSTNQRATLLSPEESEVPIILGADITGDQADSSNAKENNVFAAKSSGLHPPTQNRMPFLSDGKSPPSGLDEFSPAGIVGGHGTVQSSRGVVNNVNIVTSGPGAYNGPANAQETHGSARSSLRATVVRGVHFVQPPAPVTAPQPSYQSSRAQYGSSAKSSGRASSDYEYEFEMENLKAQQKAKKKRSCFACFGGKKNKATKKEKEKEKKKKSKRRKCCFCCICILLIFILLLALIIALAVTLGRKSRGTPGEQPVWVNLTSLPPMITGTLTVARPNLVHSQSGCVNPSTAWSCAVPKEQQQALAPNNADQPNFLFDIRYDNSSDFTKRSASGPAGVRQILKRFAFSPSPAASSMEEQKFLGNTTDGVVAPFEGESTPFYISFRSPGGAAASPPTKVKRADPSSTSNAIPNLATNIPVPPLGPGGIPPPANLLPFPSYQPARLYNRGRADEHYGFYTYYERNIFLKSDTVHNITGDMIPADANGGSTQDGANVRCTWRDTRFLVQIWTRRNTTSKILDKSSRGSSLEGGDFRRPGNFPYPISITIDRHGGGLNTKMLYCYAMDAKGKLDTSAKQFLAEDRAFNGTRISPSSGPFNSAPKVTVAEGGLGGIDGGTGGCNCKWQNWS